MSDDTGRGAPAPSRVPDIAGLRAMIASVGPDDVPGIATGSRAEAGTPGADPHGGDGDAGEGHAGRGRGENRRRRGRDAGGRGGTDGSGEAADGAARASRKNSTGGDATEPDPVERAREIVLNQLTSRAKSRSELEKVLARKEIPEDAAREVLDRMNEVGLVDDAAFAKAWVSERQQRNHLSRRALRYELSRKGVESEVLDEALETVDVDDEYAAAKALAEKKFRSVRSLEPQVQRRRISGALARKGFSYSITGAVLAEVMRADEEPIEESL